MPIFVNVYVTLLNNNITYRVIITKEYVRTFYDRSLNLVIFIVVFDVKQMCSNIGITKVQ